MAKPRLKVYRAQMGFAETVVAAPNQAAALQAWGARQNLFAEGLAEPTDDPAATCPALAHPGEVLQRPVGSMGAFGLGSAAPPTLPKAAAQPRPAKASSKPSAPPPKPPPDRSALSAAEAALAAVKAEAKTAQADLEHRRAELEREAATLKKDVEARRHKAAVAVERARAAYRKAGGEDTAP